MVVYEYKDRLNDSEIERMVLPPPPPLNIEGRSVEFDGLSTTLPGLDPQQLQMPPSDFNTDGLVSFQGEPQAQLQPHQETIPSSPLAVIRRKRANQANWEKTRKNSLQKTTEKAVTSFASRKTVFSGRLQ